MSLKATELRLGNYISVGGNTIETYQTFKPVKVTLEILRAIQTQNEQKPDAELSVFMPIPLTPVMLITSGFRERHPDLDTVLSWICPHTNVILNSNKSDPSYFFLYPALWFPTSHIKYVHQIQNLFLSLTGQELNIEL